MSLISIITPCLNGMPYLKQMLGSVLAQSHSDWQLIYIDDGSTDGSLEYVESVAAGDQRIMVLRTTGRTGAASARNMGLDAASGEYIAFLDGDDWWHPHKLSCQLAALKEHNAVFSCMSYQACSFDGTPIRTQVAEGVPTKRRHLTKDLVIGCLTAMLLRAPFSQIRFNTQLPNAEDFLFWHDILTAAESAHANSIAIDQPMAFYRVHPSGKSKNKWRHMRAHWYIYRNNLGFNIPQALYLLGNYAFNGIQDRVAFEVRPVPPA